MHIRRFRAEDIDQIVDLFRDTVRSVNLQDYTAFQVEAWAPDAIDESRWLDRMQRNESFVAVEDGTILGFTELKANGCLLMMFVHKDAQRQGIASALIEALEHDARGKGMTELHTEASITAVPFFQSHGFDIANEQNLHLKGEAFRNYDMRKKL